jgi:hypothetical protein
MRISLFLIVLFFCPVVLYSQTATPDAVFQSWNEVQLIVPVVQKEDAKGKKTNWVTATFSGILRTGRTSHPEDRRIGLIMDVRLQKHVSITSAIYYRKDEVVKYSPHIETRVEVGATFSTVWKKLSVKDRNWYEHRFRNGRANTDFYRQRIVVSYPLQREGKTLFSPFISEEGYYEIGAGRWAQNEFYAGISRALTKRSVLDIAYIRNDVKPYNTNGLSLTLKITLR